jgi:hypothetical protein
MSQKIDGGRRSHRLGAACAAVLVVLALAPGIALASDAPPDRTTPQAALWAAGFEGLWSSVVDAWNGIEGLVVSRLGDDPAPTAGLTEPVCDPACADRSMDLDPDG